MKRFAAMLMLLATLGIAGTIGCENKTPATPSTTPPATTPDKTAPATPPSTTPPPAPAPK